MTLTHSDRTRILLVTLPWIRPLSMPGGNGEQGGNAKPAEHVLLWQTGSYRELDSALERLRRTDPDLWRHTTAHWWGGKSARRAREGLAWLDGAMPAEIRLPRELTRMIRDPNVSPARKAFGPGWHIGEQIQYDKKRRVSEIMRLGEAGRSTRQIGNQVGVSHTTVANLLKAVRVAA